MMFLTLGAKPRTLADDLLITTTGPAHVAALITCTDETHRFLKLLGAKVATDKSILFSSTEPGRKALRKHKWTYNNATITVLDSFRDLGAHISTTARRSNGTGDARWSRGMAQFAKIRR